MNKKLIGIIGAGAAAGALTLGAVTMATAADDSTPTAASAGQQAAPAMGGPGAGETPLTGTDAEKVTAAAQAEIPDGTVLRVETDSEGVYEAHVQKADGTEVIVQVDADFTVTGVQEMMGRGMGGHRGGPGMGETPLTGEEAEKATAAAQAELPDGTVLRVETDADGTYEAHVRKADGTEVEVKMDKDFTVTSVEEHTFGHGPMDSDDTNTATPSA
jgi:uncharacterized membrane protein YkoI